MVGTQFLKAFTARTGLSIGPVARPMLEVVRSSGSKVDSYVAPVAAAPRAGEVVSQQSMYVVPGKAVSWAEAAARI